MTLTDRFLKAKHWHLFLLTFGLPMIFQFVMMGTIFASFSTGRQPDPSGFFNFFKFFPVVIILFTGTLFGWFWSIAVGLQRKIPANLEMKTGMFKAFFFIPLAYMLLIAIFMSTVMSRGFEGGEDPAAGWIVSSIAIVVPLHLFSMFCIFYCMYFVAKAFKTAELQRETTFSDFAGDFFLIWFYPVGIWIIQPKVNKIIDESPRLAN